ncbi:hypothetical protein BCR44DRAFT_1442114, partial [Catenaria anguillulae PL171]
MMCSGRRCGHALRGARHLNRNPMHLDLGRCSLLPRPSWRQRQRWPTAFAGQLAQPESESAFCHRQRWQWSPPPPQMMKVVVVAADFGVAATGL